MVPSIGPVAMQPGSINEVVGAVVWAQSDTGANRGSVAKLLRATDSLHQIAATNFAGFSTGVNLEKLNTKIFPNPSTDKLFVEFENAYKEITFDVYTLDGKKVLSEKRTSTRKTQLKVASLLNGVYILKINADGAEKSMKFVKQ